MQYLKTILLIALSFTCVTLHAQDKMRKLPPNINRASIDLWAPYISGDGKTILFLSNYTDDGHHAMRWSTKKTISTWNDVMDVNKLINRPTLNFRGGYSLNFDGSMMYFTSAKAGIGGFDIWSSARRGNDWAAPKNLGKPVNSRENDGSPAVSPDGEYLYFMRCEKMKAYGGASGCKLMVSKKNFRGWTEPIELPANINTGNSQTPRLLADGQTLIFSSDQMGGKGGLDLFRSIKTGDNTFTDPEPLDFANTSEDDCFVSIDSKGRYLYKDMKGPRDNELVQILIPDDMQPKRVMRVIGKVKDESGAPLNANLTIYNIDERDRLWNEKVGDKGEFTIVLNEGSAYYLTVNNGDPNYMFYSKTLDLEEIGARDRKRINAEIKPLKSGESYPIDILFEKNGYDVRDVSVYELRQLANFLRKNESIKVELEVHQTAYKEDSIYSDMDLTEERIDTIFYNPPKIDSTLIPIEYDSLITLIDRTSTTKQAFQIDSINYEAHITSDSLIIEKFTPVFTTANDSLQTDTSAVADPPAKIKSSRQSYPLVKYRTIKMYHNDRTEKQSESLVNELTELGVEAEKISLSTKKSSEIKEEDDDEPTVEVTMTVKNL